MGSQSSAVRTPRLDSASHAGPWGRYRDNLPRHLIGISRDLQARVMESLEHAHGHRKLRLSFGPFLSLIWNQGRPLGEIANDLAVSKQACGQLANLIERAGYLERIPNPQDRRSKVARLTGRGTRLVRQGMRLILEVESEYARLAGSASYRSFTTVLSSLYRGLELPVHLDSSAASFPTRSAGLLPLIVERLQRSLMQATIAKGHPGLRMSHGQVLTLIGPAGGRVHAIARLQRISRQAISAVSRDLETLGYLHRSADASDRRGVVLTLTTRGEALIVDSVDAVESLELAFCDLIGAKPLEKLQRVAHDLYHALHLEEEIFEGTIEPRSADTLQHSSKTSQSVRDIERLAANLRHQLDQGEAAQLVELLAAHAVKKSMKRT